jgi:oxygen-dependent protoporphyrinogen oxidase
MDRMEKEHGGLVRALLARRRAKAKPTRLLSFRGGMGAAVDALVRDLWPTLRTSCAVRAIEVSAGGWRVRGANGKSFEADHVVCALPASRTARLLEPLDGAAARALEDTPFASVAVVGLGIAAAALPPALDGYGYLVPRGEGMTTLGVVHDSALFADRAPETVPLRVLLGGPRDPAIAAYPDEALIALARRELAAVVGDLGEPLGAWVFRRPQAIAQYVRGHGERTARARAHLVRLAGLHLCGTSYDGVSFGSAIASGRELADRLLAEPGWATSSSSRTASRRQQTSEASSSTRAGSSTGSRAWSPRFREWLVPVLALRRAFLRTAMWRRERYDSRSRR